MVGATKVNFGWKLGPFIIAPVNHSPASNKMTTTALLTGELILFVSNYILLLNALLAIPNLVFFRVTPSITHNPRF